MSEVTENKAPINKEIQSQVTKVSFIQKARLVLMTIISIIIITFVVQNSNRVELEFLSWTFRIRIIFIILISVFFGGLINFILMKHRAAKKRKK